MSAGVIENPIVRTVSGDISPEALGVTSAHEHLICDINAPKGDKQLSGLSTPRDDVFSLETLFLVRENHLDFEENLRLDDEDAAVAELRHFKQAGGDSIIDVTCGGIGRNPAKVRAISQRSGVQVVLGSGYYVDAYQPSSVRAVNPETIAEEIVADIRDGIDGTTVRAGVIGEIGCSWPVSPSESRVLEAAAMANNETGAAIVVHPGRDSQAPSSHLGFLVSLGVEPTRVTLAHIDRRLASIDEILNLARMGCYLSFDCFGLEPWIDDRTRHMPMPSDLQRIAVIEQLFLSGFGGQILVGCDIAMKHRLRKNGGHGYDYLIRWVVPTMLARSELSESEIEMMLVRNPRNAYAFIPKNSESSTKKGRL